MKLSVIVPVYNMAGGGKLNYCMDSLVNQTVQDMEIIAVDDASTDASLEILREYEKKYPGRVRVITYPVNRRQGGAKNEGLKAAAGDWIGFMDSDDWMAPEGYEKLLLKAEQTGADVVGCDYQLVWEQGFSPGKVIQNNTAEQTGILDREKHKNFLMRFGSMVIKIYRADVIRENGLGFPEGIFYEDNCAGPVWSLYFHHFEKVEEPLYYYYQHEASTVHTVTEGRCQDRIEAARLLYEQCRDRGALQEYYPEIEYRFIEVGYVNTLFTYMQGMAHPRLSFVRRLRRLAEEHFPQFDQNPYYLRFTGREEQSLIQMQKKSDLKFFLYYRLKLAVRRWKKARRRKRGQE